MQPMIPRPDADTERMWNERMWEEDWESPKRGVWGFVLLTAVIAVALVLLIVLTTGDPVADSGVTSTFDTTIPGPTDS